MNPRCGQVDCCVPDPHPCSLKTSDIPDENLNQDYIDLINCCQRHICRSNGYCKSKYDGKCRFTYPFDPDSLESFEGIPTVTKEDLNDHQKLAYKIVEHYQKINKQLLLIINGTAGTGKSFTINALSGFLKYGLKRAAPTAKAAFLIKGSTIHSLFDIKPCRKKDKYVTLNGRKLQELQRKFIGITHIIIDEYSMLSQASLAIIDKRLREATGKHAEYFGGLSIIFTGDPAQLLPVIGSPLYHYPPKDQLSTHGYDCYRQFDKAICLKVMVRQQSTDDDLRRTFSIEKIH